MADRSVSEHDIVKGSGKVSRRDFMDTVIKYGLLLTLAGMIFPALRYVWPVTRRGPAGGMNDVGAEEDFEVWGAKKVIVSGSAILILKTPQGFKAYSAICTHLGCLVAWDDKKHVITCPCHAGVFDIDGRVVSGPPPRPLAYYPVNVVNGRVMVKV